MLKIYCTDIETNVFEEIKEFKKGSWINLTNPSEAEIKKVCENINIQEGFIRDALDFEEKARIDTEEDDSTTLFVVDVPIIEKDKEHDENDIYTTMPLGMIFVRDDYFITVSLRKNKVIESFEKMKNSVTPKFTNNLSETISQIFNNKYSKVKFNEENGLIVELENGDYVPADRLSIGTIDQLYLSLRISMIDELSEEKLPLFLDESFAYYDNNRLENALKYITNNLESRQTLIFTCANREKEILDKMGITYNYIEI